MEKIVERALLFDFYGELLTDHQKSVYAEYVQDDLSVSEIASLRGISRQGVHDLVRRCDRILGGYEDRLHLVAHFRKVREMVKDIHGHAGKIMAVVTPDSGDVTTVVTPDSGEKIFQVRDHAERIQEISERILDEY